MASTQVARAAAQLHEAALDVARVAALRSARPQEPTTGPQVPQQPEHANNEDGDDGPVTAGTVAEEMAHNDPGGTPLTGTTARRRTVDHRPRPTRPPPRWPLKAVLDLGAVLTAPGCARAWTREILWEWRNRRQLHSMRIGDGVRAGRLRRAEMRCDLAVQRGECVRRG